MLSLTQKVKEPKWNLEQMSVPDCCVCCATISEGKKSRFKNFLLWWIFICVKQLLTPSNWQTVKINVMTQGDPSQRDILDCTSLFIHQFIHTYPSLYIQFLVWTVCISVFLPHLWRLFVSRIDFKWVTLAHSVLLVFVLYNVVQRSPFLLSTIEVQVLTNMFSSVCVYAWLSGNVLGYLRSTVPQVTQIHQNTLN